MAGQAPAHKRQVTAVIDVPETLHSQRERGRVAVDGKRTDDEHPVWCSSAHCFVTDKGVRVHRQAPIYWEAQCVVALRFETCLIDPDARRHHLP